MATRSLDVVRGLRDAILAGVYAPEARLSEMELAERFGVSRTPVRSALGILATEGLLSYRPNCGYVVRSFTAADVMQVYDVRATLEGMAARLAAERGLDAALSARLEAALEAGRTLCTAHRPEAALAERWGEVNEAFHQVLFEACGNPYLVEMVARARAMPLLRRIKMQWHDRMAIQRGQDEHADIAAAIRARQGSRAEALLREHVLRVGRVLSENWERTQGPGGRPSRLQSVA
ncbi:GntR family transcriptional regulator [Roseomonas sp. GC11]|uniref:GntR family transcriptional regulator n=1 Tax=Roseomonas sp. GC11 TaxID=2950546 RepID=UPI00210B2CA3|nr:GntR family transcriptional regulator [Roseomonas sp. GC11]MCQ4159356.1 GntR family transcriptional regulator [Roseomonas sp. GC11]